MVTLRTKPVTAGNHPEDEEDEDAVDDDNQQDHHLQHHVLTIQTETMNHHHQNIIQNQPHSSLHYELQWYIISCVCQIFWTISTCEQVMTWSIFFLLCHILTLYQLLIHIQNDYDSTSSTTSSLTISYYWIYNFPHQVNLSWSYYLLLLILQIVNQQSAMYFKSQITWAFISIVFIFFVGVYHGYLAGVQYPTITICLAFLMVNFMS